VRTIKARLTLWYMLLLFGTLLIFSIVTYVGVSRSVLGSFDRTMQTDVMAFAHESEIEDDGDLDLETEVLTHGERVTAYNDQGQVVAQVGAPLEGSSPGLPPPGFDRVVEDGVPWRQLSVYAPNVGLYLQVSRSREEVESSLRSLFWFLFLGVPLTTMLAGVGGLFLASRLLTPLDKITRAAANLSASGLAQRLPPMETSDELSRLVDTFNAMLARLEDAFGRQRQFTSDAAHELRNPLALMMARTEVTLSRDRTSQEYQDALVEIRQGLTDMTGMVVKLLTLARADAGNLALDYEPLDLAELAGDAVSAMESIHPQAKLQTELSCAPVSGDQTRLSEILLNLLDNALKFSPLGKPIMIRVWSEKGQAWLEVSDHGPGVEAIHQDRIFERFYQADSARARASGSGGAGLGLAIGRAIARQHGGDLTLKTSGGGPGATFLLRLPTRSQG
jgi:heavy metal sensor kinase